LPESYKDLVVKGRPFPFRPNMSATADIQTKTEANVLAVPLAAVTTRDKKGDAVQQEKMLIQKTMPLRQEKQNQLLW
jgi:HlyD family secretion protein